MSTQPTYPYLLVFVDETHHRHIASYVFRDCTVKEAEELAVDLHTHKHPYTEAQKRYRVEYSADSVYVSNDPIEGANEQAGKEIA